GSCDEGGEPLVDADGVCEVQAVGDSEGALVAVTQLTDLDTGFGGDHRGAGGSQDPVPRGGASRTEGPEPVDDPIPVQQGEAATGFDDGGEGQLGELGGSQDAMLEQHPQNPPIPAGEPHSQTGVADRRRCPGWSGCSQIPLPIRVIDHRSNLRELNYLARQVNPCGLTGSGQAGIAATDRWSSRFCEIRPRFVGVGFCRLRGWKRCGEASTGSGAYLAGAPRHGWWQGLGGEGERWRLLAADQ